MKTDIYWALVLIMFIGIGAILSVAIDGCMRNQQLDRIEKKLDRP